MGRRPADRNQKNEYFYLGAAERGLGCTADPFFMARCRRAPLGSWSKISGCFLSLITSRHLQL